MNTVGYKIQLDTITSGYDRKTCWVHARGGAIPGDSPAVVVMMQKLLLTGNDIFYALNEMRTDDTGKTWQGPVSHDKSLSRIKGADGTEICPCDFYPKWHKKTGTFLGTGHIAIYHKNELVPNPHRQTCYSVYDHVNRIWTPFETLEMPEQNTKFYNSGAGSVQRYDLPDGDILLPIYFRGAEATAKVGDNPFADVPYAVTVLRCGFDGKKMRYIEHGNEITIPDVRGFCEPSITCFQDKYYLTLRNDNAGYVTVSSDGLHFDEPVEWRWDDGSSLGNYNTQQHWVTHSDALFLVYTRRGADNDNVMRHRAPLFIAQVDPVKLCVIRETERILVPNRGARLGNFGVTDVSPDETWVTVTEWMQTTEPDPFDSTVCEKYGSNNSVFAARIIWDKPNAYCGR